MISIINKYNNLLIKHPLLTKCITSSIIMCSANLTVQKIESYKRDSKILFKNSILFGIICGGLQKAPFMHFFYNVSYKWIIPKQISICAVFIDPINYLSAMMLNNLLIQKKNFKNGLKIIENDFWKIYKTGLYIWPVAQCINFYYVPLHWRVLYFNSVSFIWNCWLANQLIEH